MADKIFDYICKFIDTDVFFTVFCLLFAISCIITIYKALK